MKFTLRHIPGKSRKVYKEWHCPPYRILWRSEAFGISVPPGFQACIRVGTSWDWVERRGLYKSFNVALKACEKHALDNNVQYKKRRVKPSEPVDLAVGDGGQ